MKCIMHMYVLFIVPPCLDGGSPEPRIGKAVSKYM